MRGSASTRARPPRSAARPPRHHRFRHARGGAGLHADLGAGERHAVARRHRARRSATASPRPMSMRASSATPMTARRPRPTASASTSPTATSRSWGRASRSPSIRSTTRPSAPPTAATRSRSTRRSRSAPASGLLANDTDAEGGPLAVASVEGSAASVGTAITLDSGATLTVNADGSFALHPGSRLLRSRQLHLRAGRRRRCRRTGHRQPHGRTRGAVVRAQPQRGRRELHRGGRHRSSSPTLPTPSAAGPTRSRGRSPTPRTTRSIRASATVRSATTSRSRTAPIPSSSNSPRSTSTRPASASSTSRSRTMSCSTTSTSSPRPAARTSPTRPTRSSSTSPTAPSTSTSSRASRTPRSAPSASPASSPWASRRWRRPTATRSARTRR